MQGERTRKLVLVVLCINVTLLLFGLLLVWRAQRAAGRTPAIPTDLARIAAPDTPADGRLRYAVHRTAGG